MSRFNLFIMLASVMLATAGCSHNYFNIPRDTYEQKVRVLGVAPIFVDRESDIRHPEKETLVALIKDFNRKNEPELVAGIKDAGNYFSVSLLPNDADSLFSSLFFRREKRDDAGIVYNKYFYKGPETRDLMAKNNVDALLLLVVSGLTVRDTAYSSNLLSKLETDYNYLSVTGQIIDPEGNILWEFPNFRQRNLSYPKFFGVQFPDFDEAKANETDKVEVKFKTIPGINRFLGKSSKSSLRPNASVSDAYSAMFDEIVLLLRRPVNPFGEAKKEKPSPAGAPQTAPPPKGQTSQPNVQSAPINTTSPSLQASPAPGSKAGLSNSSAHLSAIVPPQGSPPAEPVASPALAPAN